MPCGRPRKHPTVRNTAGLCNQKSPVLQTTTPTDGPSSESDSSSSYEKKTKRARTQSHNPSPETCSMGDSEDDWQPPLVIDSLKFIADNESDNDLESSAQDINFLFPDVSDNETYTRLINLAIRTGDDPSDETWLPESRTRQQKKATGRPTEYKRGPDISSKSARTKRHY
ncbi:hypothetical protein BKA83DRAFT_4057030 [Pisolithus microcarpus]|nr:hypothetical protein BKA83DRAFT_4057030 [Pisolithus microcarpus]